jgi:hypothetical protein
MRIPASRLSGWCSRRGSHVGRRFHAFKRSAGTAPADAQTF